jgi:hypothetical protein
MKKGMNLCDKSTLRIGKLLRLQMQRVVDVLKEYPEFYIIHLVRDPRAIALSRINTRGMVIDPVTKDITLEAHALCVQMRNDLYYSKVIMEKYPGAYHRLRYEDLVLDPVSSIEHLYRVIGRAKFNVVDWTNLTQEMFSGDKDGSAFGTRRINGSASIDKWRTEISLKDLRSIQQSCIDVLRELDYPVLDI